MNTSPGNPVIRFTPWEVWKNPIFRRYCQSRLRARPVGLAVLVTVLVCGFVVGMADSVGVRTGLSPTDAARGAIIPLLVVQGVILFMLGTAQVAGGMTAERDEGVIDYQRLLPLTPLTKVAGYLFGLPVREYLMFAVSLPFTAWCLWVGAVDWQVWLPLYTALASSTLLYHLTGLLTGTVVRNRRWAFLVSIGLVFCLYTVIPQVAKFGLVFFKYLTVTPVFRESLPGLLPEAAGAMVKAGQRLLPTARFFNLDFSEVVFTLFSQGGLILAFVVMLCRRWRRAESHLLGKLWATGLFAWIQILLLGNALPLIDPGTLFPSREFGRMTGINFEWQPAAAEAVAMSGIYGAVTLVLLWVLGGIITPSLDHQVRGWRRARKQGRGALPRMSDESTAGLWVAGMALAGASGWVVFTRALVESRWFPGQVVPPLVAPCLVAVLLAAGLGFQALLEWKGGRIVGLVAILLGVVPLMVGSVLSVISESLYPAGVWLACMSPASLPFYASSALLPLAELPASLARAVPRAFAFWLVAALMATAWLQLNLWRHRRSIARRAVVTDGAD